MIDTKTLFEIANYLGRNNIVSQIRTIDERAKQENPMLVLPLVGEFSSGKTSLINSLTDSKKLETATKPTTATIYEVHFGCDKARATVMNRDGSMFEVDDLAELKNENLADSKVVTVFDTSNRVPASTILVDTPGLSSPDPQHKQTLVDFLPKADGILLVSDVNQQLTRSLTEFIDTMKLSNKPIFLVLTKSDTKSESDIQAAKQYISDNCKIPVKQIAVVSASTGNLDELYSLFDIIQREKQSIIQRSDAQRIQSIAAILLESINELIASSSSDSDLDEAVLQAQRDLSKLSRSIERFLSSTEEDISDLTKSVSRKFEDVVFSKLNNLVSNGRNSNLDAEAVSYINSASTMLLNEYKDKVHEILKEKAKDGLGTSEDISLNALAMLDVSNLSVSNLSYDLNLNAMGHEYDRWIKTGVVVAAAAGALYFGGAEMLAAGGADCITDIADTVSDIESIKSNKDTVNAIDRSVNGQSQLTGGPTQASRQQPGLLDSMVGLVTDKTMAKPQRVRAVRVFVDTTLAPEFKSAMSDVQRNLFSSIKTTLENEISEIVDDKKKMLTSLKSDRASKTEEFNKRMAQLKEYRAMLNN